MTENEQPENSTTARMTEEQAALAREALLRYFKTINEALAEYNKVLKSEIEGHYTVKNEVFPPQSR